MCVCIYEPNCKNGAESHKPKLVAAKIPVAGKHEQCSCLLDAVEEW